MLRPPCEQCKKMLRPPISISDDHVINATSLTWKFNIQFQVPSQQIIKTKVFICFIFLRSLTTFGVDSPKCPKFFYTLWRGQLKHFLTKKFLGLTWTCTCRAPFSWQKWEKFCLILTNWLNEFSFWVLQTVPWGPLKTITERLFGISDPK